MHPIYLRGGKISSNGYIYYIYHNIHISGAMWVISNIKCDYFTLIAYQITGKQFVSMTLSSLLTKTFI